MAQPKPENKLAEQLKKLRPKFCLLRLNETEVVTITPPAFPMELCCGVIF